MKSAFSIFALITLALLSYGLYQGLIVAPREMTMGDVQRIFYYHVPSAWTAFLCFFANLVASIWYLATREPKADAIALSTAEVGVVFCTVVLVTGPIWAKPIWGIWWTWDARLTSTLVLWLIYVSYLLLRRYSTAGQNPVLASVLAIFGAVDVVFVYMAIRWFRTQHPQPVVGGGEGSGIDPRMMNALLMNWVGFLGLALLVIWLRYKLERLRQQVEEAHAMRAIAGAKGVAR
ncbi:MAG: cytochrome c biogenesis protein CcsA [Acidobacteriia bacterium]|nr:cytochrome c biogenesis protein CcsA [Terriglobia bacterium]